MIALWGPRARGWRVRPCEWTQPVREHRARAQAAAGAGVLACNGAERQKLLNVLSAPQGQKGQSVLCPGPCAAHLRYMRPGLWKQRLLRRVGPARVRPHRVYVVSSLEAGPGVRRLMP